MGIADRDYMKSPEAVARTRAVGREPRPFPRAALPRKARRRLHATALAAVVGALALGGGYAAGLAGLGPFASEPSGIVWAGHRFESRAELASWLRDRGASYSAWAKRHPAAAAELERP